MFLPSSTQKASTVYGFAETDLMKKAAHLTHSTNKTVLFNLNYDSTSNINPSKEYFKYNVIKGRDFHAFSSGDSLFTRGEVSSLNT